MEADGSWWLGWDESQVAGVGEVKETLKPGFAQGIYAFTSMICSWDHHKEEFMVS